MVGTDTLWGGVEGVTTVGEPFTQDSDGEEGQGEEYGTDRSEDELPSDSDEDGEDKLEEEDGKDGCGNSENDIRVS